MSVYKKENTCCFTGHRPMKLPWGMNEQDGRCIELKAELAARLVGAYEQGYRKFVCGMAIGCDMYFAEAVLELKKSYPDVYLEAAIPCGGQPERWHKKERERYNFLIDSADEVNVLQIEYTPDCMMKRNRYMVDNSSMIIACFDGRPGGTMSTILYAQRSGLKVLICDIDTN